MALYQPTNIIPSSFTQGTVDVNDNMEISWQVNGNSAMTAFQIDFYLNDAASTFVYSTGKIRTDEFGYPNAEEQEKHGLPFYGTDRFGRPQFFPYNAGITWEDKGFTNGNEYKYKITQWYKDNPLVARALHPNGRPALESGKTYYFRPYVQENGTTKYLGYVSFTPNDENVKFMVGNPIFYYDFTNQKSWFVSDENVLHIIPMNITATQPIGSTPVAATISLQANTARENFIQQTSSNSFITRTTPTLTLQQTDENYLNPMDLLDTLTTSIVYFHANYIQEQNDSIRWIRWQIATANNGVVGSILVDTGDIYTPTLNFEFNGFFNGNRYAIRCFGESESGQATQLQGANADGWIFFNISFKAETYNGAFTAQCLQKENATLLKWDELTSIPAVAEGEIYPNTFDGYITLPPSSFVSWNEVNEQPMQDKIVPQWTAVIKLQLRKDLKRLSQSGDFPTIKKLIFSPDGSLLLIVENNSNNPVSIWAVSESGALSKISNLQRGGTNLINVANCAFSADGEYLVAVGSFPGGAALYSVNNSTFTFVSNVTKNNTSLGNNVYDVSFSPINSKMFILGGSENNGFTTSVFNIIEDTDTVKSGWLSDIKGESNEPLLGGRPVERITFTPNGESVVFGGDVVYVSVCSVDGSEVKWLYDIKGKGDFIDAQSISPNGNILLLAERSKTGVSIFNIQNGKFSYFKDFTDTSLTSISIISFSHDGTMSLLANTFKNAATLCSVIGENVYFKKYLTELNIDYGSYLYSAQFSTVSNLLVIGGTFTNNIATYQTVWGTQGQIFKINTVDNFTVSGSQNTLNVTYGAQTVANFTYSDNVTESVILITPTTATAYFYVNDEVDSRSTTQITYIQQPIASIAAYGGDDGVTFENVVVYDGDGDNILSLYENPNFEPSWNNAEYVLYMNANFIKSLNGGSGNGFRIYRQEVGKNTLTPIATLSRTTTSLKDYGISSRKAYKYSLHVYDTTDAFMSAVEAENIIATNFKNYSLLVCDYDEANDEYHVRKQYLFALNLSTGSVGNNNSPTLNANFTQYPTRMPSAQNYASGTLSGLIGAIYTVPALIEQIGQYKYTAKPSTLDYFDSVDLEKELYDLSTAPYQLFLRDMKGRLRMIATSGAISMTTNIKQKQQAISISFPWVEVGDASDVTIIQTPDDYGWNNDNQVLDVSLDVDVETGELSATYPFPYNGTKFYLTGVNKENLTAKTPLGITPAQFELSETATQPDDGELTAMVKVNSEDSLDDDMDWGAYELADIDTEDEDN